MQFFGKKDLEELLATSGGPAVSIYLPQDGEAPDPEHNRLRFRAALERAGELLERDERFASAGDLLWPLRPLGANREAWNGSGGAVAAFGAPDFSRVYRLPADLPELVVVGPSFHTRPLVSYLQAPDRFWVLELGQGAVRLWTGDAQRVRPLESSPLPADMESALGFRFTRDPEVVHRAAKRGTRSGNIRSQGGGSVGAFHGHGVGANDRDPELERFFRVVDEALAESLGARRDPVILAAVAEHHPLYRAITRLENLAPEGIEASIHGWPADRVHERAWPIALAAVEERMERSLELWETAYGRGKGEMDLAALGRLAVAGRIRALLIEQGRHVWGTLDRSTGEMEIVQEGGADPGPDAVELLDELSELVLLRGGTTLAIPAERMPTATGAAGVLR